MVRALSASSGIVVFVQVIAADNPIGEEIWGSKASALLSQAEADDAQNAGGQEREHGWLRHGSRSEIESSHQSPAYRASTVILISAENSVCCASAR